MKHLALALALATPFATACKRRDKAASGVDSLAKITTGEVTNTFLMFGAPGDQSAVDYLPAVALDLRMLESQFGHPKLGFQAKTYLDVTADQILASTEQYARDAKGDGTLIWAFSGHGMNAGELVIHDEILKFAHIAQAIKDGRANRPLKRLVVIVDACYAGNLVDGLTPVTKYNLTGQATDADRLDAANEIMFDNIVQGFGIPTAPGGAGYGLSGELFEELIVLTSAKKDQPSNSDAEKGSQMVQALNATLKQITEGGVSPTIDAFFGNVLTGTLAMNEGRRNHQVPLYRKIPDGIGREFVEFGR